MQLFGTDDLGRDLFVRTMLGVQVTILVAVVASFVSLLIGVLYGMRLRALSVGASTPS